MRKLFALFAVAAAAVLVPTKVAAAPVQATLSASITQSGGTFLSDDATIEGVGTVSGVGRVSFVAYWFSTCAWRSDVCFTTEQVELTAQNGDTLTLSGGSNERNYPNQLSVLPWSVLGGTGRFASASGNGTFSFNFDVIAMTATVAMTGTLSR
jgi:hypothetical protein